LLLAKNFPRGPTIGVLGYLGAGQPAIEAEPGFRQDQIECAGQIFVADDLVGREFAVDRLEALLVDLTVVEQKLQAHRLAVQQGEHLGRALLDRHPIVAHCFGFHSRASFCASAICAGVIIVAMKSRYLAAPAATPVFPWAALRFHHMCAAT
jgi:hypothetical protein